MPGTDNVMLGRIRDQIKKLIENIGSGGSGSALAVADNHIFTTTALRDAYFASNPAELVNDLYCVVNGVLYQYKTASTAWVDMTAVIQGPSGTGVSVEVSNHVIMSMPVAATINGHRAVTVDANGKLIHLDATDASKVNRYLGIALESVTVADAAARFIRIGEVTEPTWAFTVGPVYVGAAGVLTQSTSGLAFIQQVGVAISATTLVVGVQPPILLG